MGFTVDFSEFDKPRHQKDAYSIRCIRATLHCARSSSVIRQVSNLC